MNNRNFHRQPKATRKSGGFTLIELMVTVAIVGILASIAYPSYTSQVRKSRRAEAVAETSRIQQAQERWRANCPQYSGNLPASQPAPPNCEATSGLNITAASDARYTYTLSVDPIPAIAATSYTLTATAKAGSTQATDTGCNILTVTVRNGTGVNGPPNCWSK